MSTWFTADPHFDHANIIRHCSRPFANVAEMNQALIDRHNEVVGPGDTVWILGDVSLSWQALVWVRRLNGRKILVPGNHDECWHVRGAAAAGSKARYLAAGFDRIVDGPTAIMIAGVTVLLNHLPYRRADPDDVVADTTGIERYQEHRPADGGAWLLHGHVHELWRQRQRQINVGVDAWGGSPVSLRTLAALIAAGPANLDAPPWHEARGGSVASEGT